MLKKTFTLYSLNEQDITVSKQPAAALTELKVATHLLGGVQEKCAQHGTKQGCDAEDGCRWISGDCNDDGTGDWDQ